MTVSRLPTRLVCSGCGGEPDPGESHPFRCPAAEPGDDTDHVLTRVLDVSALGDDARSIFLDAEPNPFLRYRKLFHSYHVALAGGMSDADFVAIVQDLDRAVARVEGRGFAATPFGPAPELGRRTGFDPPEGLWIKNETGNVAGSHKARHLMGILIWLEVVGRLGWNGSRSTVASPSGPDEPASASAPPLAIASCGNAALAAGVVARAAGRELDVFIPPEADPWIVKRLHELGAHLVACPRVADERGDPCHHRFREALDGGALPFTVQGSENGLNLEGGQTLGYEMVSDLVRENRELDRLFIQVGGGALTASTFRAFEEAVEFGLLPRLPRLHAVQTAGGAPLERAHTRIAAEIARRAGRDEVPPKLVDEVLHHAATHRSDFMWPWETEPASLATGILDDETYDWLAVVRGMLVSGGSPVVVPEDAVREAHALAGEATGISVDPTGSAGLAGLMQLEREDGLKSGETAAVLFTGAER